MKKQPLLWFLSILACISLACDSTEIFKNLPGRSLDVKTVTISPTHGSGEFTGTVEIVSRKDNDTIICYTYDDISGGKTNQVFSKLIMYNSGPQKFSFTFIDTNPGVHHLVCRNWAYSSSQGVDFTVDSGSEVQATQPPVAQTSLSPDQFKTATLSLGSLNQNGTVGGVPNWCFTGDFAGGNPIPPLSVTHDGTLTGLCKGSFKDGSLSVSYSGTTNGNWNTQTGTVTWEMDMSDQFTHSPYSATHIIKIHGSAPITTASDGVVSAQGIAEWTDSCNASAKVGPICDGPDSTSYNAHGTLDWKMTFNP